MRKVMRMLMVSLVLLVVPKMNAREEIACVPGEFRYIRDLGWKCAFTEQGTHCLLCGMTITVEG